MAFYSFDGDHWTEHALLVIAADACAEAIDNARDYCDPEWPSYVEEIQVREGPAGVTRDHDELPLILVATETNRQYPSSALDEDGYDDEDNYWGNGVEYYCDYAMRPPRRPIEDPAQTELPLGDAA